MKNVLAFLLICIFSFTYAQDTQFIDAKNVRARMNSYGMMFRNVDHIHGFTLLDQNKNEMGSTMSNAQLWLAGYDKNNALDIVHGTYHPIYTPGPIESSGIDFDKVWKVKGQEIKNLIDDFADGMINDDIAEDILSWPAKGNPFYNGKLDQDLAPFKDSNDDGIYNPLDGDHPIIGYDLPHVIPQEMLYCVNHPIEYIWLNIEIQTIMYSLSCEEKAFLDNTIFTRHYIDLKKSDTENLYCSYFFDQEIGCPSDDYAGFDLKTQTAYAYNRFTKDDSNQACNNTEITMKVTPAQGTTILNHSFDSFFSLHGGTGILPGGQDWEDDQYSFQFMNGFWPDGTPLTMGGNGYNPGSTDITKFAYTGNPLDGTGWIQNIPDSNNEDIRGIASLEYKNVQPNDVLILDMAHHFALDPALDNIQIIKPLLNQAEELRQLHESNYELACFSYIANEDSYENLVVYPNPAKDKLNLVEDYNAATFYIYNFLGKLIKQGTVNGQIIDVSDLNQGLYTLVIKGDDKTSSTKFMVE